MRTFLLKLRIVFVVLLLAGVQFDSDAQTTNLALTATANHSGGGVTVFGPTAYNDQVIPSTCPPQPWGWVSTNGWIEFTWTTPERIGKMVFLKADRPMTTCTLQYWNGSAYVNITNYSGTSCEDSITFPSVTTTRIRMNAVAGSSNPNHREILIYSTAVPCDDTIESSVIKGPYQVCPNKEFALNIALNSGMLISGMTHQWQYSNNGITWSNFTGVPSSAPGGEIKDIITSERWYRCVLTCTANNKTFTTAPHKVSIAPFYYCYCDNEVTVDGGGNIGKVGIVNVRNDDTVFNKGTLVTGSGVPVFNNSQANKKYTGYHDSLGRSCLYRDSTYRFVISQIHTGGSLTPSFAQVYIDFNRDGVYNPNTEKLFLKAIDGTSTPPQFAVTTYKIPSTAQIGLTGMRVVISQDTVAGAPCDTISGYGEVEDYIVEICNRPCSGPVNTGVVVSTDTSMCSGYEYVLTDTTYEKTVSAFSRAWQVSGDEKVWFNINNSAEKDTLNRVYTGQPLFYRVRTICLPTNDTAYSASTEIKLKPAYKCYCYSKAIGGLGVDSSDIGGVSVGPYSNNSGGPHLLNALARYPRTDYTDSDPIELFTDSAYRFSVYHTMPVVEHGDAKVTIFMDFNNNHKYDLPSERIYTGFTSIGNHTLVDNVVIPVNAILDVPTGMRIILNNNVGPNVPSDEACGPYLSGETEDYILIFRDKAKLGIAGLSGLSGFGVHPNPTTGKFHVQFSAHANLSQVDIRVTNVTGQLMQQHSYTYEGGIFDKELDMSNSPSGVYFVELQADGQKFMSKLLVQ